MDLKQFENSINKKFQDFEPEVDSLKIWDNIEADLPPKKKSRYFGLWIGLLLIPLAAFYFYNNGSENTSNAISENDHVIDSKQEFTEVKKEESITEVVALNDQVLTENSSTKETRITKNDKGQSKSIKEKSKSIGTPTFAQAEKIVEKVTEVKTTDLPIFAEAERVETNENISKKEKLNTNEDQLASQLQSSGNQEIIPIIPNEQNQEAASEKPIEVQDKEEAEAQRETEVVINDLGDNESENEKPVVDSQEAIGQSIMANDAEALPRTEPSTVTESEKEDEIKSSQRLSMSLLAGVLGSNRIYADGLTEENILTIAEKETAERQLETLQLDAMLKYKISPRFSVGLGIRNWRLSEKSTYATERVTEGTIEVVTEVVHHPDNTIEETPSNVPVFYTEITQNTRYQTHQAWSIPVRLYYTLVSKDRFDFEIAGGYEYGLTAKHVGYELDANATEYLMTLDPDNRYEENGGDFLLFNINTNYKLKNSLAITAGLEGKYGLNGFNTETAIYQKKYHFFGLYTGLSYSF